VRICWKACVTPVPSLAEVSTKEEMEYFFAKEMPSSNFTFLSEKSSRSLCPQHSTVSQ
jgi:hypothetical protein